MDEEEVNKLNDLNKNIIEEVTSKISCDAVMEKVADLDTIMEEATVEGAYYDTIDEALDMYTKYAEMAGFEIKKRGQKLTKSGAVQHMYIYCNKEGVLKDGAMKRAIEAVFKKAKHGLCMWTTSRSESENPFFKSFTSPGETLVSFMMSYESAMERQRYRQETLDFKTIDAAPKCETKLEIERCETVIIRDKKPNDNRSLFYKQKGKEQEKKTETVGETARDYK
nr:FAR1 DNA binding domain-containing protein [Tanacetum cinerariifolium]